MNEFIGRALRIERNKRGWSIDDLHARWPSSDKPSTRSIARWECGHPPTVVTLSTLVSVFGMELSVLLSRAEALKDEFEGARVPEG